MAHVSLLGVGTVLVVVLTLVFLWSYAHAKP
jgi:hypothetical protein